MASVYIILTVLMLASTYSQAEIVPGSKITTHYILEPNKLELKCIVKNASEELVWYKDSTKIVKNKGFEMTTSVDKKTYTLTKPNTTYNDTGSYKCFGAVTKVSVSFKVEVFKVITHDIVIVSKEPALIKCDIQNLHTSIQGFHWEKNHTILDKVDEINGRYKEYNYTLEILKAKRRDAGVYNCVYKIDDHEISINVNMNMAPWIESMEKSRNLVQGDKLHLECNVQSHPYSFVTWKKDNETFKNEATNRVFLNNNRTLIIYDLQFSDRGDYTCVATNTVNTTSMTVLVRVKDKLAALWPFLGIVAEVVILCIIIFICEKRRSKDMEEEYDNAGPQSMPNAKDHKGKDEIRQRNVRT